MPRGGYVYMLTNQGRSVIYTGVTSDLPARMAQHVSGEGSQFTKRYKATHLVYFTYFNDIREAIAFEKQVKAGSRNAKEALIVAQNPKWRDLLKDF